MIKNLRHVGLVVSDMARAIRWYRKHLGCEIISHCVEHWRDKRLDICKMTNNIELIMGDWVNHVAFTVVEHDPNLWEIFAEKKEVRFIKDPDGNVIELVKEDE